ncbi:hypothetical protein DFH29DRAFT_1003403 [Suillus ampliporus]|nr:hypothetical protein DFH29DRAFT_1003403 [Suillus ampliporus]
MFSFSSHNSSSSNGGEPDFPVNTHLDVNYSLFESEGDHSDLALEAAKAKQKCHRVEVANCHLLNADLNVGHMHMERKKSGIAAFTRSDSGLMMIADNLLTFIFVNNPGHINIDGEEGDEDEEVDEEHVEEGVKANKDGSSMDDEESEQSEDSWDADGDDVCASNLAVFTSTLDIAQAETKGTVLIKDADEMLNVTSGEEQHLEKIFKEISDSGIKDILAGSSIGNTTSIASILPFPKSSSSAESSMLHLSPALVHPPQKRQATFDTTEIGGDCVTVLSQLAAGGEGYSMVMIMLRGATANYLDDLEHAIDNGVNVIKSLIKDPRLVPGAGTTELELGKPMDAYGDEEARATYREAVYNNAGRHSPDTRRERPGRC